MEISISCDDGIKNGEETGLDCGGNCSNPCPPENALEGILVTRLVLHPNIEYVLTGPLIVRDGAVLEMDAGTIIKAQSNKNAYITVAQGGKLYIWGTEENPVVITSDSETPAPGDWGGLVICGKAPSNNGVNARSELVDFFYGGNEITDTSGVIRYLRLEYTGENFTESKKFNGISFYGVGSFTTVEHIQTYESLGNGFEIVGGTLNAKYLVSTNSYQNSISIKDGWNGSGNYWYLKGAINSNLKLANNKTNGSATPITNGSLNNLSIINTASDGALQYTNGGGIYDINEIYTSNIVLGMNIVGNLETTMVEDGNLTINTIQFDNPANGFIPTNFSGSTNFYTEGNSLGAGNGALQPDWAINWTVGF
ncbi:MAG TPA: hypothetical protein VGA80_09970 [Flavobacteriaceae bacterium]